MKYILDPIIKEKFLNLNKLYEQGIRAATSTFGQKL